MAPEEGSLSYPNVKISVGVSALVSLVAIVLTWGVTWGVYSQRLATQEANSARDAAAIEANSRLNMSQETKLAVISSQYAEIIRRLDELGKDREHGR